MKGKKKWLTIGVLMAVAAAQTLATAGVVPPLVGELLLALGQLAGAVPAP